mmetsp:Transcript_9736/g.14681  ORF Transcript_9736/g.14681 Transcript_9736/m.14681 type:complete len:415 (+) Transcript_9736:161-1405(+)
MLIQALIKTISTGCLNRVIPHQLIHLSCGSMGVQAALHSSVFSLRMVPVQSLKMAYLPLIIPIHGIIMRMLCGLTSQLMSDIRMVHPLKISTTMRQRLLRICTIFFRNSLFPIPSTQKTSFFVFGESYGGHYAPAISSRIFEGNQAALEGTVKINLKGVGVGNGLTDPLIQYGYYPQMAMNNTYDIKCVSEETYENMVDRLPFCQKLIAACQGNTSLCLPADDYCNLVETTPYYRTGLNPYDIRKPCGESDLCYDFSNLDVFLNLESTRDALHVSDKVKEWVSCNTAVDLAIAPYDWMKNFQGTIAPMVEGGVRVLIYAGDTDFICNWMGNKAWTLAIAWDGREAFHAEGDHEWFYDEARTQLGGWARSASSTSGAGGSLTFLQVKEAGHMVPMDQPEAALSMINAFTSNSPFY